MSDLGPELILFSQKLMINQLFYLEENALLERKLLFTGIYFK
jgi:hypothetical protein